MAVLLLFNKPFRVLCQFSPEGDKATLADYIQMPGVYPAGRLDYDSEGLLLLSDSPRLRDRLTHPRHKLPKTYWAQVENIPAEAALERLRQGVLLNDGWTLPAQARLIEEPDLWPRDPPIRYRAAIPTAWIELQIHEGRNRQARRMVAAIGHPALRLVRCAVGEWRVDGIGVGEYRQPAAVA
jgi:23S rRNA pseudouridine2457 synthase